MSTKKCRYRDYSRTDFIAKIDELNKEIRRLNGVCEELRTQRRYATMQPFTRYNPNTGAYNP